jgi:hypothetical protein
MNPTHAKSSGGYKAVDIELSETRPGIPVAILENRPIKNESICTTEKVCYYLLPSQAEQKITPTG